MLLIAPTTSAVNARSLRDALPIWLRRDSGTLRQLLRKATARKNLDHVSAGAFDKTLTEALLRSGLDRKSTRLNSSHSQTSYAVFCLKKKNPKPEVAHGLRAWQQEG